MPAQQIAVEAIHEQRRGGVVHLPERQANRAASGQKEGLSEAEQPVASAWPTQAAFAGRERHQLGVELPEFEHFGGRQAPIHERLARSR